MSSVGPSNTPKQRGRRHRKHNNGQRPAPTVVHSGSSKAKVADWQAFASGASTELKIPQARALSDHGLKASEAGDVVQGVDEDVGAVDVAQPDESIPQSEPEHHTIAKKKHKVLRSHVIPGIEVRKVVLPGQRKPQAKMTQSPKGKQREELEPGMDAVSTAKVQNAWSRVTGRYMGPDASILNHNWTSISAMIRASSGASSPAMTVRSLLSSSTKAVTGRSLDSTQQSGLDRFSETGSDQSFGGHESWLDVEFDEDSTSEVPTRPEDEEQQQQQQQERNDSSESQSQLGLEEFRQRLWQHQAFQTILETQLLRQARNEFERLYLKRRNLEYQISFQENGVFSDFMVAASGDDLARMIEREKEKIQDCELRMEKAVREAEQKTRDELANGAMRRHQDVLLANEAGIQLELDAEDKNEIERRWKEILDPLAVPESAG